MSGAVNEVECRLCGHWQRHHDGKSCTVVAGTADGLRESIFRQVMLAMAAKCLERGRP